jgi:hypothetical protein
MEKHRLSVNENRVRRITFGLKSKDKVEGGSRRSRMRSFKICTSRQILLEDKIRRISWAGHVALVREKRSECRVFK